jgi:hypothetical protein
VRPKWRGRKEYFISRARL